MPSPYSEDLKERVFKVVDKKTMTIKKSVKYSKYNAPICLDHFFQSDPIFKMNMLINTSTHI